MVFSLLQFIFHSFLVTSKRFSLPSMNTFKYSLVLILCCFYCILLNVHPSFSDFTKALFLSTIIVPLHYSPRSYPFSLLYTPFFLKFSSFPVFRCLTLFPFLSQPRPYIYTKLEKNVVRFERLNYRS